MSNVTLHIGGRNFTVASADGEESHIEMLGRMIDDRLKRMGSATGQSESRTLLFAALLLADELHEAHNRPNGAGQPAAPAPSPADPVLLARIADLSARVEKLAARIEHDLEEGALPS